MESITDLQSRVIVLESAVALLLRMAPHQDVIVQGMESLAAELQANGTPESSLRLVTVLRSITAATDPAAAAPGSPASPPTSPAG